MNKSSFEEQLKKGRLIYTNKGDSMMPLIKRDRDLVVIEPVHDRLKNMMYRCISVITGNTSCTGYSRSAEMTMSCVGIIVGRRSTAYRTDTLSAFLLPLSEMEKR